MKTNRRMLTWALALVMIISMFSGMGAFAATSRQQALIIAALFI